jgi:hypothetical protein
MVKKLNILMPVYIPVRSLDKTIGYYRYIPVPLDLLSKNMIGRKFFDTCRMIIGRITLGIQLLF